MFQGKLTAAKCTGFREFYLQNSKGEFLHEVTIRINADGDRQTKTLLRRMFEQIQAGGVTIR